MSCALCCGDGFVCCVWMLVCVCLFVHRLLRRSLCVFVALRLSTLLYDRCAGSGLLFCLFR